MEVKIWCLAPKRASLSVELQTYEMADLFPQIHLFDVNKIN